MQITSTSVRSSAGGFALLVTMVFLGVVLLVFASVMYWASGNAKITERNNQYNMSSAAAESAVEMVTSQMERDFNYGSLTTADSYASLPINQSNWPIQYVFSDPTGAITNGIHVYGATPSTNSQPLGSQYGGLYGFAWNWTVSAKATPVLKRGFSDYVVPAIITETNNFASIPIFQFAIFYNINLEIDPGSSMTIAGPVFCNKDIWAGSSVLSFSSTVAAVGHVNTTTTDPFSDPSGRYTGTGTPTFSLSGQPTDSNPSLSMPIGTNNSPDAVQSMIELPPAAYALGTPAAFSTNGLVYMANAADLYISNSISGTNNIAPTGTNTFVYYQDGSVVPRQTLLTPDFYILRKTAPTGFYTNYVTTNQLATVDCTTNVIFAGYSFITNALFYDWREGWSTTATKGKAVQAVQIDIAKFNLWLTNAAQSNNATVYSGQCQLHKGHYIDSMYIYTSVPLTTTTLPAVRVVNGKLLPSPHLSTRGLAVVTQFPMYVWGDYNATDISGVSALGLYGTATATLHTYPAALMADSITILSDSWSDAATGKLPSPSATTVNAAMLEGIVPTNPSISANYSGGVENFMRLLENWGGTLTYNGSIVVMFNSQYATNIWRATGNYYNAPTRHWSFDLNYSKGQSYLPPLTPETKALVRVQWMAK